MTKSLKFLSLMLLSSVLLFSCGENTSESISDIPSDTSSEIENSNTDSSNEENSETSSNTSSTNDSSTTEDSSSSENSSSNENSSSSDNSSSSEDSSSSEEPVYVTLDTPVLSLNEDTGVVTISDIENANYYQYYINGGELQSLTTTTITLKDGESLVVLANSTDEYTLPSEWSNPISYFKKEIVPETMVKVYLHNSEFSSVEIKKGTTYTPSIPSNKEGYTFENWYIDPFYTKVYNPTSINENTILYAHFIEDKCIEDVTYWVKANSYITHPNQQTYMGSSWKFIPLTLDKTSSNVKMFSTTVTVSNTTSTAYGEFIVMDGFDDTSGRTYWKNDVNNFTIKTDGTYKINFSLEKKWTAGSYDVHAYVEQISTDINPKRPLHSQQELVELQTPVVNIDKTNHLASWTIQENATYAYQIDNGEIMYTTDNNVTLNEGSFIVVKAIANAPATTDSKWSMPYLYQVTYQEGVEYCYVYFYDNDLPSIKVEKGSVITRPNDPTKSKYRFDNWYTTISKTTVFDFTTPINKNTVIYPKWIALEDYKTTTYYILEDASGNKIGDLSLYEPNLSYNEYHIEYTLDAASTLYVKRLSDGVKFGPYVMDNAGVYDMYFSEEHIWDVNTDKARNAYWALQEITIYFTNTRNWDNVYYYTWDSNNNYQTAWPGQLATFDSTNSYGQDIYKVTINKNVYANIIFNGGSGRGQTENINISSCKTNDAFYITGEKDSNGHYKVGTWTYK